MNHDNNDTNASATAVDTMTSFHFLEKHKGIGPSYPVHGACYGCPTLSRRVHPCNTQTVQTVIAVIILPGNKLSGDQDLVTKFQLLPLYQRYWGVVQKMPGVINEKSTEKKDPEITGRPELEPTPHCYVQDLPGKLDFTPDHYMRTLILTPRKTYGAIQPLDANTLRNAFALRPGPVPGFDPSILGGDDTAPPNTLTPGKGTDDIDRDDRKHKKKKKRKHEGDEKDAERSERKRQKRKDKEAAAAAAAAAAASGVGYS